MDLGVYYQIYEIYALRHICISHLVLSSQNQKGEQKPIWILQRSKIPPLSLKTKTPDHKEKSPFMLRWFTILKQQYSLCAGPLFLLSTKFFFHTVFPKLLAFHCTSQLEIDLVQLVAGLQIMPKVISSQNTLGFQTAQQGNKELSEKT